MKLKKEELKIMFRKKLKEGKNEDQAYKELAAELDYLNKVEKSFKKNKDNKTFKEIFNELKYKNIH